MSHTSFSFHGLPPPPRALLPCRPAPPAPASAPETMTRTSHFPILPPATWKSTRETPASEMVGAMGWWRIEWKEVRCRKQGRRGRWMGIGFWSTRWTVLFAGRRGRRTARTSHGELVLSWMQVDKNWFFFFFGILVRGEFYFIYV